MRKSLPVPAHVNAPSEESPNERIIRGSEEPPCLRVDVMIWMFEVWWDHTSHDDLTVKLTIAHHPGGNFFATESGSMTLSGIPTERFSRFFKSLAFTNHHHPLGTGNAPSMINHDQSSPVEGACTCRAIGTHCAMCGASGGRAGGFYREIGRSWR